MDKNSQNITVHNNIPGLIDGLQGSVKSISQLKGFLAAKRLRSPDLDDRDGKKDKDMFSCLIWRIP